MAEIRCPVCGRSNPIDQEACQTCGTPLAPGGAEAGKQERSDLPEWLRDFRVDEGQALPESGGESEPAGQPFAGDAEDQDWLDRLESQPEASQPPAGFPPGSQSGEAEPEWLQRIRRRKEDEASEDEIPAQAPEWTASPSGEPEAETPDWLSVPGEEIPTGGEEPSGPGGAEPEAAQEGESEPLPDWMLQESGEAEEEFELEPPVAQEGELPDWLQSIRKGEAQTQASEETPAEAPTEPEPESQQLQEVEESPAAPVEQAAAAQGPLTTDEVSAWLSSESQAEGEPPAAEEAEEQLAPAELPGWLEALRPVEGLPAPVPPAPQVPEQPESAGPLAGLRRVLAAEPGAARVQKPAAYSVKLQVSDSQQAHIDKLKQIVETEGKAKPLAFSRAISSQHLLRIAIAILLFLAVLWPLLTSNQSAPLPLFSPETDEFYRIVEQLPGQARVLVGFDYEPGVAGELDAAASVVIDHLMLKGAYLTLVSTTPAGPIMGERLIQSTLASHKYTAGDQYIDLGYIPGGTTGLTSFAASPQRTVPLTMDGKSAWERPGRTALPPLEGINRLADFALALIITENPDTARAWIEQVQPSLSGEAGQTPLLVVASAQAEPLVRPYYSATPQQVQGMVVGLQGAAAYARLTGQGGLPALYWDAFGTGLVVAVALIVIGGLVSLIAFGISSAEKNQAAKWSRSPNPITEPTGRKGQA